MTLFYKKENIYRLSRKLRRVLIFVFQSQHVHLSVNDKNWFSVKLHLIFVGNVSRSQEVVIISGFWHILISTSIFKVTHEINVDFKSTLKLTLITTKKSFSHFEINLDLKKKTVFHILKSTLI